jgi:L-2,4-diaminobutyrate decarboxylase
MIVAPFRELHSITGSGASLFESEFLSSAKSGRIYQRLITNAAALVAKSLPAKPYRGLSPQKLVPLLDPDLLSRDPASRARLAATLRKVVANSINVSHPHTAAHLHCPPLLSSLAAEVVISALNQSMDSFDQAPIATMMEQQLIHFLCRIVGLPSRANGTMTTGGSQSNFMGLLLARDMVIQKRWNHSVQQSGIPSMAGRLRILCSAVSHFTVEKSAAQLGLGTDSVIRIPVDSHFRMDIPALRRAIQQLKKESLYAMAVVGTAGTTDFGSIDPLREIEEVAHEAEAWFHVDAAYGGALLFSGRYRNRLDSVELADSIAIDFHKLFWQPIPCSAFLLRDEGEFDYIKMHADYLNPETLEEAGVPNLVTTSLLTSRRFDALKLWISLQSLGRKKLSAMIDRTITLAKDVAKTIRKEARFELLCEPELSTVVFRYLPAKPGLDADRINFAIRQQLFETGTAVIGHTRVRGQQCLKFTCMNPSTTKGQMNEILQLILEEGRKCEADRKAVKARHS